MNITERQFAEIKLAVEGLAGIAEEWAPDYDEDMGKGVLADIAYYRDKFRQVEKSL